MVRAIALLSGGLDSTLAVKLILEQKIDVIALNFVTPFCTCTKSGCQNQAKKMADKFGIDMKVVSLKEEYIDIIKNPKYGYGKNMNPCIDCRILMFSKAREYMNEVGASFVFSGEVLGERPMSQRLKAMQVIERESGLTRKLLRPLCAQFLEPTIPEIEGIVDRNQLLAIQGRSRKPQISLARERGIDDYPCPAGGCRLTDPNFAERFKEALEHHEDSLDEIILLRYGRHFRLPNGAKVIVGRDEIENNKLKTLSKEEDSVLEVTCHPGPITLLKNSRAHRDIEIAAALCVSYSDYKGEEPVAVKVADGELLATCMPRDSFSHLRINKEV
jgi:tRNA U34 2-thiouridine synthase MnmA/TrmU